MLLLPLSRARLLRVTVLSCLGIVLAACDRGQSQTPQAAPPPPQVTVARPVAKSVVSQDEYVGRFVAVDSIEVRARVSGYLAAVHFKDGQTVKQGDLLFTIDRRPFQATLDQARGALAQAKANLAYATSDLERAQPLVGSSVISRQTFDQRIQAKKVAEANVAAQEAAVRQAELDLEFTELRAPVSGRIGDRRVSPGNLVTGGTTGNTTLLATIQSTDPIRFEFTMDEASYLRYVRMAGTARDLANDGGRVPVKVKLLDESTFAHEGRLDFVDNAIDRSSGTIRGRAELRNPDGTLTPGMFGRVQVASGPPSEALLLPDAAIGTEQVNKFVLVVDDQNVARAKYVTLGALVDGMRVVASGLSPDDRVVVNGLMRARPGMKVNPQSTTAEAAVGGARSATN
ncbi:MAG TPA: efflux RND transporter periplasmic adaptor subunit [Hyphomicrobiaceae bacterium]|nr:efflux RND transporter periplasmic adaptor subunit [Hyphomicrobiaceae bacterium]